MDLYAGAVRLREQFAQRVEAIRNADAFRQRFGSVEIPGIAAAAYLPSRTPFR